MFIRFKILAPGLHAHPGNIYAYFSVTLRLLSKPVIPNFMHCKIVWTLLQLIHVEGSPKSGSKPHPFSLCKGCCLCDCTGCCFRASRTGCCFSISVFAIIVDQLRGNLLQSFPIHLTCTDLIASSWIVNILATPLMFVIGVLPVFSP